MNKEDLAGFVVDSDSSIAEKLVQIRVYSVTGTEDFKLGNALIGRPFYNPYSEKKQQDNACRHNGQEQVFPLHNKKFLEVKDVPDGTI